MVAPGVQTLVIGVDKDVGVEEVKTAVERELRGFKPTHTQLMGAPSTAVLNLVCQLVGETSLVSFYPASGYVHPVPLSAAFGVFPWVPYPAKKAELMLAASWWRITPTTLIRMECSFEDRALWSFFQSDVEELVKTVTAVLRGSTLPSAPILVLVPVEWAEGIDYLEGVDRVQKIVGDRMRVILDVGSIGKEMSVCGL